MMEVDDVMPRENGWKGAITLLENEWMLRWVNEQHAE